MTPSKKNIARLKAKVRTCRDAYRERLAKNPLDPAKTALSNLEKAERELEAAQGHAPSPEQQALPGMGDG